MRFAFASEEPIARSGGIAPEAQDDVSIDDAAANAWYGLTGCEARLVNLRMGCGARCACGEHMGMCCAICAAPVCLQCGEITSSTCEGGALVCTVWGVALVAAFLR